MKAKLGFAFVWGLAAAALALQVPAAAQQFAAASDATPAPTATPKTLGHQTVSAFCTAFVTRYNDAETTLLGDDRLLDDAIAAETDYENDFFRLDGESRRWNHRLSMIAALTQIIHTIPKTQAAVNDLRAQAAASVDAERRAALSEGAAELQTSVDHQRIVADELTDAVDSMLDVHTGDDAISAHHGADLPPVRAAGAYYGSALEVIMHMPHDRQLAEDAESNAAMAVTAVVRSCALESSPL
jgi:hypothetical protein